MKTAAILALLVSFAALGGVVCNGSAAVKSGDTFSLTVSGTTYTATDTTTGKTMCSTNSTFVGNPSIQVDWRGKTGTDKIGPVTITGAAPAPPVAPSTITFSETLTVSGKTVTGTCVAPLVAQ
jgi:hypothetical protein